MYPAAAWFPWSPPHRCSEDPRGVSQHPGYICNRQSQQGQTAEETQESAMRAARNIEKEAMTKAEIAINDARRELDMIHQRTVQLAQQYEKYKLQFKNLAISQIELLETESYQIHIMDVPEITMPEPAPMAEKTYYATQEEAANDFSFTNVASEEE